MINICLHFQVHQPWRLRTYRYSEVGIHHDYFDNEKNAHHIRRITDRCYLPMNNLILDLSTEFGNAFKVGYGISGTFLQQAEEYVPEVVHSFKRLTSSEQIELSAATAHHSFSALLSPTEFREQLKLHNGLCSQLLRKPDPVFFNPLHSVDGFVPISLVNELHDLGMKAIILEDSTRILGFKTPSYTYTLKKAPPVTILPRSARLSEDIAFRFSDHTWPEWPLTSEKFVHWLEAIHDSDPEQELFVGLFLNYETFGERHHTASGIFDFMRTFPRRLLESGFARFVTPREAAELIAPTAEVKASPAVTRRTTLGSPIQTAAIQAIYRLEKAIKATDDLILIEMWRRLTTSDHFTYMSTRGMGSGFSPFESPYEAHIHFMNVLADLEHTLEVPPIEQERRIPA